MAATKIFPSNFAEATEELNGRDRRKVYNNTYLERRSRDRIALRLHDTDVVTYHADGRLTLDSGGWPTVTTKHRIKGALFHTPWTIYQERKVWYLQGPDGVRVEFFDGITLDLNENELALAA